MKFSILVNNYNYGRFLRRAIDSALTQSWRDLEVIVVDDGSTDESSEIIRSYGDIIIALFKQNGGQASCFNAGFAASTGDVICLLDADDYFRPEKLERLSEFYHGGDDIGWCFHALTVVDRAGCRLGRDGADVSLRVDLRAQLRRSIRSGISSARLPATTGLTFRRSVLQQLLPMPEAPRISIGDHYLKLGAAIATPGLQIADELAVQVLHEENGYTGTARHVLRGEILVRTAEALRSRFPDVTPFADSLVGTARAWLDAGDEAAEVPSQLIAAYERDASRGRRLRIRGWEQLKRTSAAFRTVAGAFCGRWLAPNENA